MTGVFECTFVAWNNHKSLIKNGKKARKGVGSLVFLYDRRGRKSSVMSCE